MRCDEIERTYHHQPSCLTKGEHTINFPQHDTQNVMLLFGDNMRGKTSFLNAALGVLWCRQGKHLRALFPG